MIIQSTLNAFMQKIRPGNIQTEPGDAKLRLHNNLIHAGRFPFPFTKSIASNAVLPVGEDVIGSFNAYREQPIGTALTLTPWIAMPPGIWDIELFYYLRPSGIISDLTAVASLDIQITDGTVIRISPLAILVGTLAIQQQFTRRFTVSVSKDIPVQFNLGHVIGLGTSTSIATAQLLANRIF